MFRRRRRELRHPVRGLPAETASFFEISPLHFHPCRRNRRKSHANRPHVLQQRIFCDKSEKNDISDQRPKGDCTSACRLHSRARVSPPSESNIFWPFPGGIANPSIFRKQDKIRLRWYRCTVHADSHRLPLSSFYSRKKP